MDLSVHDNILYAHTVVSGPYRTRAYTITLYTEYLDIPPVEYTDIVFTGVVAHHFESALPNSIIFDVEAIDLADSYKASAALFERLQNYGWPWIYASVDELFLTLQTQQIHAFGIHSSYGIEGWIWAEHMSFSSRAERKILSD